MQETPKPASSDTLQPEQIFGEHAEGEIRRPEVGAMRRFLREIFEVTQPALKEELQDFTNTNSKLTITAAEAFRDFTTSPWNVPKHLRQVDTALRGRDLGSLKMHLARHAIYSLLGGAATLVDIVDLPVDAVLTSSVPYIGAGLSAGWEFLTDSAILYGTEAGVQFATKEQKVPYASPLARTLSAVISTIPILRQGVNPVNLESEMRKAYNIPITGIPVEYLYKFANKKIIEIARNPRAHWVQDLIFHIIGGQFKKIGSTRQPTQNV